ncbi:MAG: hypothetical protein FJ405_14635 [Verrucomicrobia bacterium]|nr:hypothetical protein [Verrucomicrobiota bacterium]
MIDGWDVHGVSTTVPPLSGWKDPATEPLRPVPEVATDQWRDGLALLEQGWPPSAPFVRQSHGSYLVGEDDALLDLRASGASMPEDQILRVKARGKGFRLEARRTDADASGKPFAFGFQFQSDPPKIALTTTYNRRPAEDRVNQTPPRGFNWDATHTLTMAVIGDRVSAWVDGEEMLTLRRSGPLAGHMAIRAAKGSVIEKVEFADLGRSGPPPLGVEQTLDGHRYRVVWAPGILWEDARAQAERLGGHLVTITHRKEQELIARMCSGGLQELGGGGQFWLGGARKGGEGDQWRWITGQPFAFTHWAKGKPESSKGAKDLAITILSPDGGPGWNDWAGRNSREHADPWIEGYIVEWSPR